MPMINLHTHYATGADQVIELVNQYPADADSTIGLYSIGIHPWHITPEKIGNELAMVENHLRNENCLAVGECGLDKRTNTPFDLQQQVFEWHLELAQQYKKPVIIHCVAAFQELIAIKNAMKIDVPMVIHGFSKSTELTRQMLDSGFYLSFGKYLLRNPELEITFNDVPTDRYFLETDSGDYSIFDVYQRAAQYKNQTMAEICAQTTSNFSTVFNYNI